MAIILTITFIQVATGSFTSPSPLRFCCCGNSWRVVVGLPVIESLFSSLIG
jgi:hypothetical protein